MKTRRGRGSATEIGHNLPVRRAFIQILIFSAVFMAVCLAWQSYRASADLTSIFRISFGVVPLYMQEMPLDFGDGQVVARLMLAMSIALAGVIITFVAALRRWRAWVCVLVAAMSVASVNASIAHIREGENSFVAPFLRRGLEYYFDIPAVNDAPRQFISNYAAISPSLSHHAGTHPPGGVLFLWMGAKLFGESANAAAWWAVSVGALAVIPTYWLASMILGSSRARRVLPLYLLTPSLVIFGATSMDIVFLTFATSALAAIFWVMRPTPLSQQALAVRVLAAGLLYWLAAFMTFAVIILPVLAGCYVLAYAFKRPRQAMHLLLRLALVGLAFVFWQALAQLLLGYDLKLVADIAMLRDLRGVQVSGHENFEIWGKYSLANLLAFLLGTGLALSAAMIVGVLMIRSLSRRAACLALATPLTLLAISMSTLFTLETERVWLSAVPAMLVVAASLRGWTLWAMVLILGGVQTFLVECTFYTYW